MGAGASSFPDLLTEEQIKAITASDFKDHLYATLQDADGTVPKQLFVNCFEKGPEREVFQLFMAYSPDGTMTKGTFLSLCRVNKLLHKNTCTSIMAGSVFNRSLRALKRDPDASPRMSDAIGFNQFRTLVVPEFAKLKKMEENALIDKLSLCEFPSSVTLAGSQLSKSQKGAQDDTPLPEFDPTAQPVAADETVKKEEAEARELKHPKLSLDVSAEIMTSFIQLQSISRRKLAKRKMEQLKEVRAIETGKAPRSRRPTIEPQISKRRGSRDGDRVQTLMAEQEAVKKEIKELMGQVTEENASFEEPPEPEKALTPAEIAEHSLHDLFDLYCSPPGEMDINFFKKFMRETYTLTKKFTVNDADGLFKKVVAKASTSPQTSLMGQGVFFGKRIDFYVFYHSAIPLVAKARNGIKTKELIDFLNNANVAARARDIKKRGQDNAKLSRRPSKDNTPAAVKRRPSRDLPPAHLSSKDNDPNPFARRRPSSEKAPTAAASRRSFENGPRRSFDKGARTSFDKSSSAAEIPKTADATQEVSSATDAAP